MKTPSLILKVNLFSLFTPSPGRHTIKSKIYIFAQNYISAGPSEYLILDSNSEFFVLLELNSDKTLLGPSIEWYKLQKKKIYWHIKNELVPVTFVNLIFRNFA